MTGVPASVSYASRPTRLAARLKRLAVGAVGPALYTSARSIYRMAMDREERHSPLSLRAKVAAWRRGFAADSAAIFDFARNNPDDYIGEYLREYRCSQINPANEFYAHKLMWRSFMINAGFPQAETVALVAYGQVVMYPFDSARRRYVSPAEAERWLVEDGGVFIFKPEKGDRGQGIFLVHARDGALVRQRGDHTSRFQISEAPRVTIVERQIRQHEFWRTLFPHSANTIRALTLWTPGDAEPFLARAVQRLGTVHTMPTDNWSGGGICAPIDLATGRLESAVMHSIRSRPSAGSLTHHPDSGARISGQVLPYWDRIQDVVLRAARSLPVNRYIGWDIVVDELGTPVVIEANGNPGLQMVQVERGLLADAAIRRFYQATGVV
jgi:hypothetical protein